MTSFSQTTESLLYNIKGQLRADTSLIIDSDQLTKWMRVEDQIITEIVNRIEYSEMASDYNLTGISIVSFNIDSNGSMKDFKILKQVGGGLEEKIRICINSIGCLNSLAPTDKINYTYFLTFEFLLIDSKEFIKKENAIPVYKVKFDRIQK